MKCTKEDIEIVKRICREEKPAGKEKINELRAQIYAELHKPDDEMDCDLIDENIRTLFLLEGGEYDDHVDAAAGLEKARKMAEERAKAAQPKLKRVLQYKFMKPVLAACIAVLFLFSANAIAVYATGDGILDNVVRFGKNYISFNFVNENGQTSSETEALPSNNKLYQDLKQRCQKYDLIPLLPKTLPQNFEITGFEEKEFKIRKVLAIKLGNKANAILLHIDYYFDPNSISEIKTPDITDYEKITVHGNDIYLVKNGNAYIAMFRDGNYVYNINLNLSHDETVDLLNSMSH